MTLRTKSDFNDPRRLSAENTIEAQLLKKQKENPYKMNKAMRNITKGIYNGDDNVKKLHDQNDGYLQQQTVKQ